MYIKSASPLRHATLYFRTHLITSCIHVKMSRPGDFDVLTGTEVRLDDPSPTLPAKTFILDEKLSEEYRKRSQLDCDEGKAPPFAILSFSCHNSLNPSQQGFIRIYRQIPIDGTVLHPPKIRAWQASRPRFHAEIEALKQLYDKNCAAVPKLLGLGTELQGAGDFVPGGYITSIAWERVSGERIEYRDFRKRDLEYRDQVRLAFSIAYE